MPLPYPTNIKLQFSTLPKQNLVTWKRCHVPRRKGLSSKWFCRCWLTTLPGKLTAGTQNHPIWKENHLPNLHSRSFSRQFSRVYDLTFRQSRLAGWKSTSLAAKKGEEVDFGFSRLGGLKFFNSKKPWKMLKHGAHGWKTILSYWVLVPFHGQTVKLREGMHVSFGYIPQIVTVTARRITVLVGNPNLNLHLPLASWVGG